MSSLVTQVSAMTERVHFRCNIVGTASKSKCLMSTNVARPAVKGGRLARCIVPNVIEPISGGVGNEGS